MTTAESNLLWFFIGFEPVWGPVAAVLILMGVVAFLFRHEVRWHQWWDQGSSCLIENDGYSYRPRND